MPPRKNKKLGPTSSATKPGLRGARAKLPPQNEAQPTKNNKLSSTPQSRKYFFMTLLTILLVGLLYLGRGLFVAAVVNGSVISRFEVIGELEKTQGSRVLNTLIAKKLIEQEAKRRGITVSDREAEDDLKKFEQNLQKQGQTMDQFLAFQGLTRAGFKKEIKLQKMLEKLLGNETEVGDKEVDEYIEKNKETLLPEGGEVTQETKDQVKAQLKQQKFSQKIQELLDSLRKKAKISQFVKY